ncbi:hypothetical protein ACWKSP_41105 [Micromonosporaceae bacterium Da 78-11]
MMYGYGNGMSGWVYLLMIVALVAIALLAAVGVLVLIRTMAATRRPATDLMRRQEAQRILEQRFARGEVDQDEFRMRADVLRGTGKP